MNTQPAPVRGVAAGVPFLAFPPADQTQAAPAVVAWHLLDPPRSEAAFAAALPFEGLDAWRIYLGLPMTGDRLPIGGPDELMRLAMEDAVRGLHGPIATAGAAEFPAAYADLQKRLGLTGGPLALVGGSLGSAIALLVLAESAPAADLSVAAAVLVSPVAQLRPMVDAIGRQYGMPYAWGPDSLEIAGRLDFVARADEIAAAGQPAVRLVVGADDDGDGFLSPAQRLHAALTERYDDPAAVDLVVVPGMGHALAEEPGVEPAPQTAAARAVDRHAVEWLQRHLPGAAGATADAAAGSEPVALAPDAVSSRRIEELRHAEMHAGDPAP